MLLLIVEINNEECLKSIPIYKNGGCSNDYCTEDEFKNGDCIINNSIIKTQWLNKIISFGDNEITKFITIEMPNKDIFLLGTQNTPEYIYIYGLKSSGEPYYNENNKNYKEIIISYGYYLKSINGVGLIINNHQYILICLIDYDQNDSCELIDLENNNIAYNEYI